MRAFAGLRKKSGPAVLPKPKAREARRTKLIAEASIQLAQRLERRARHMAGRAARSPRNSNERDRCQAEADVLTFLVQQLRQIQGVQS